MKSLYVVGLIVSVAALGVSTALDASIGVPLGFCSFIAFLILLGATLAPVRQAILQSSDRRKDDNLFLAKLVVAGVLVRLSFSALIHITGWWVYLGGDEGTFDGNGRVFQLWLQGLCPIRLSPRFLDSYEVGYFYLVGGIYYTFGVSKVIPLILNSLLGAGLAYPTFALAGMMGGRTAARRAALLSVLFPSFILWSSLMVRDIVVLFVLVSLLLFVERLRRALTVQSVAGLLVCLFAVATLRTYIFLIIVVAMVVSFLLGRRNTLQASVIAVALAVTAALVIGLTGIGTTEIQSANLEYLSMRRHYNALGPTDHGALDSSVDISTPAGALSYLPMGLMYFWFSPLPWQIRSPRQVLAVADLCVWYAIIPSILTGMFFLAKRRLRVMIPTLFVVASISVLYALVEGNIGIAFRHRAQIIAPLCPLAGVGYALRRRRKSREKSRNEGAVSVHAPPGGTLRSSEDLRPSPGT